jgi:hypothetical protein
MSIHLGNPVLLDSVRGDASGLTLPAHGEALRIAGAAFLTEDTDLQTPGRGRAPGIPNAES